MEQIELEISIGAMHVRCKGPINFVKDELFEVVNQFMTSPDVGRTVASSENYSAGAGHGTATHSQLSINSVVARLGGDSCKKLLISAAVFLTLCKGKERFTRDEWIEAAKQSSQWKVEYSNQMATAISRSIKSTEINENAKNVYSLSPKLIAEAKAALDQG